LRIKTASNEPTKPAPNMVTERAIYSEFEQQFTQIETKPL
jgi:hypothetical protein